jgi:hypothetical protein
MSGSGSGTIQASPAGPYYYGASVTIWANASTGSSFTGFTGALTGTTSPQVLVMDGNKTVDAQFTFENNAPTQGTPLLISEYGTNTTDEKLICYNQSTNDVDEDTVYNTYHWLKNGVSLTNLLLPFNTANSTNVKDYSGYHNNGTITGATWISSGIIGGAYNFDGINDYISIADTSSLDGDGNWSGLTVEYWLYLNTNQTSKTLIAKYGGTDVNERSYLMYISGATANKLFGAVAREGNAYIYQEFTTIPFKQVWYHVTMVYKAGDGLRVYLNGELDGTKLGYSGNIQESPGKDLYIGCRYGTQAFLDGMIDEVKIYPFALTPQQISQDYNDSKDGYSDVSRVVKEETSMGDIWQCDVTPSDGMVDGLTKVSNSLTILTEYTLTLTKSGTGQGTIEASSAGPFYYGSTVTIWANASVGSRFTGFTGALTGITTPQVLVMNGNKTVTATFQDSVPPVIKNILATPMSTSQGGFVNITCNVTDNVEVDIVKIVISGPVGFTPVNVTMNAGSYYYNATYDIPGFYNYFIWANDTSDNSNTSTIQQFTILTINTISLKQKWNLLSLPINQTLNKTEITIQNNSIDYTWSEAITAGIILDFIYGWNRIGQTYYIAEHFEPGQGYWLWSYYNCTLLINGIPTISNDVTALSITWNIMGLPVNTTIAKNDLLIRYNGTDYNWTEATTGTDPILLGFIYVWNAPLQQYQLSEVLEAKKAYWMYAYHSCDLRRS